MNLVCLHPFHVLPVQMVGKHPRDGHHCCFFHPAAEHHAPHLLPRHLYDLFSPEECFCPAALPLKMVCVRAMSFLRREMRATFFNCPVDFWILRWKISWERSVIFCLSSGSLRSLNSFG